MKVFTCDHCGQLLFFDNDRCERCGHSLGFDPETLSLLTLVPSGDGKYHEEKNPGKHYRYCLNHNYQVCNWLVAGDSHDLFCTACRHNRIIPNLQDPEFAYRWRRVEQAKHRLIYQLLRMKLPLKTKAEDQQEGLMFDFLSDSGDKEVMTGHDNGLITLNISEADDAEREQARRQMEEAYRTVLGHFRHEIGHYYWDRLVAGNYNLGGYRGLFGNETADYQQALDRHYSEGAPSNWPDRYISAYATMHPWEDWAETWAHYMHIMDTLETAYAMGLSVQPGAHVLENAFITRIDLDPYTVPNFYTLFEWWLPVAMSLNSISRSMGQQDLYPFIIPPKVADKLAFIHTIIKRIG
ncbi:MAG: putative zinc-binding peptidase [Mucilaginibacter polytrichastri]|nr:putative zinc-binding peptidase [Mucilaginibacter polytrichastri]